MSKARISPTTTAGGTTSIPPPVAKYRGECMFFAQGMCRKGAQCPYVHSPPTGRQSEAKNGGQNNNAEPSPNAHAHPSPARRASPDLEHADLNKSKGPTSSQKGPKPQGKPNRRPPKKQELEAASPNILAKQRTQPGSPLVQQPPTQAFNEGKKCRQAKTQPCVQWTKTGKCTRGEACGYRHDAKGDGESGRDKAPSSTGEGLRKPGDNTKKAEERTHQAPRTGQPSSSTWAKGSCKQGLGYGRSSQHGAEQGMGPRVKPAGKKRREPPASRNYTPRGREVMPEPRPPSEEDAALLQTLEKESQKAYIWALKRVWGGR